MKRLVYLGSALAAAALAVACARDGAHANAPSQTTTTGAPLSTGVETAPNYSTPNASMPGDSTPGGLSSGASMSGADPWAPSQFEVRDGGH